MLVFMFIRDILLSSFELENSLWSLKSEKIYNFGLLRFCHRRYVGSQRGYGPQRDELRRAGCQRTGADHQRADRPTHHRSG